MATVLELLKKANVVEDELWAVGLPKRNRSKLFAHMSELRYISYKDQKIFILRPEKNVFKIEKVFKKEDIKKIKVRYGSFFLSRVCVIKTDQVIFKIDITSHGKNMKKIKRKMMSL